jgi:N-acetyl-alpha-D-muramate 1-phosphate uridylyltransferase
MGKAGHRAMVLAAGLGKRMRPLTDSVPKPLVNVAGKPLIDYSMDRLREAGVAQAVVNCHYLADQIIAWAKHQSSPPVTISDERGMLLDTGGGILKALPLLGPEPFFVLNSDSIWTERGHLALERLRAAWDHARMDCLLLTCPIAQARGYDGEGDFAVAKDGRLTREKGEHTSVYIGAYLVHPSLFQEAQGKSFSMNALWNISMARGRLFGIAHDGLWLHVGTPEAIPMAEAELAQAGA